jgi:hypothetical protein
MNAAIPVRTAAAVLFASAAAAQQPPFGIALEQAYLDLHHALSIEIQVMRVDGGAEQIWSRSFTLVQRYLPSCAALYQQSHTLVPPLEAAFRSRDVTNANALARRASQFLAEADSCAKSIDVFASGAAPPDEEDDPRPAASSLAEANRIAGNILSGLSALFGAEQVRELSVPRSHIANAQSAVEVAVSDYLAGAALGAVVARLTKGQVTNFVGRLGEKIIGEVYPNSRRVTLPEAPGRVIDLYDAATKTAREVKTGRPNVNSTSVQRQIANDRQLVQAGYKVEWWNVRSPFTGQEFSEELVKTLQQAGIFPVSHIHR